MCQENIFHSPKGSLLYEVLPVYHYQCSWKKICLDHEYSEEREIARQGERPQHKKSDNPEFKCVCVCVCVSVCVCGVLATQSCPILCHPMDYSPPGSSVRGVLQARILEWGATSFSRGSSPPSDRSNLGLLHCQVDPLSLHRLGSLGSNDVT